MTDVGKVPAATGEDARDQAPIVNAPIVNAMTVDVEDYFQVQAFARVVSPARLAFDYEITGPAALVAVGSTVHATMDRGGRPMRMPERIRELLR